MLEEMAEWMLLGRRRCWDEGEEGRGDGRVDLRASLCARAIQTNPTKTPVTPNLSPAAFSFPQTPFFVKRLYIVVNNSDIIKLT